jgi:inhibitor of cysteine peptidase
MYQEPDFPRVFLRPSSHVITRSFLCPVFTLVDTILPALFLHHFSCVKIFYYNTGSHWVTMKASRNQGHIIHGIIGLGIMLALLVLVCGCTQQSSTPTPAQTAVTTPASSVMTTPTMAEGKKMFTFTEADNGRSGNVTRNTRFAIVLEENPTTGFMWNETLSSGLELQSSDYRQDDAPAGMVGVGGTRTWVIVAKDLGDQKFSAIYRRSWENVTGNETTYSVNIKVVGA